MAKTIDQFLQDQLGSLLLENVKLAAALEAAREEIERLKAVPKKDS